MELDDFLSLYFKKYNKVLIDDLAEIVEYNVGNGLVSVDHLFDIYSVRDESYCERHNSDESPFTHFLSELEIHKNSLENVRLSYVHTNSFMYMAFTDPLNENILADLHSPIR